MGFQWKQLRFNKQKEMKMTRYFLLIVVAVLTLGMTACSSEDIAQDKKNNNASSPDIHGLTAFITGDTPITRTSLDHTAVGGGAEFFWETGDKIWVKNGSMLTQNKTDDISGKVASAKFYFEGSFPNNTYKVYYTGKNGATGDKVTIAAVQKQSQPNNTEHFGESGDCGVADANKSGGRFNFELEHKAAYLCFLPRTTNPVFAGCTLMKIVVIANNDIAGTYNFGDGGLDMSSATSTSKKITLTCGNGFPLTNTTTDFSTNAAYMVIAPGTHALTVKYWLKESSSGMEGTVTKFISSRDYQANTITDLTANIDRNYSSEYYMWDAQNEYWAGVPNRPTVPNEHNDNYPKDKNDANHRWYNEAAFPTPASNKCADCPNANEIRWYAEKGDPHWDEEELWTMFGKLHKGGMWFKKQKPIAEENSSITGGDVAYLKTKAPDGTTDYRTATGVSIYKHNNLPKIYDSPLENPENYFYLPASGYYRNGVYDNTGFGNYWSSSPYLGSMTHPGSTAKSAYYMYFSRDYVYISDYERECGFRIWKADGQ